MKKLMVFAVAVFFLISFVAIGFAGEQRHLTQKQLNLLKVLQDKGVIRINYKLNRVEIDPGLWKSMKYDLKEAFSSQLAIYCGNMKGTYIYWVEIFDMYSGKKLAKYSYTFGFKVFQ